MEHNHLTIKTFMAITAERDAAIRERNMALEERKKAFAERDMAMLQRDAAVAERNAAMQERDEAITALQYQESSIDKNVSDFIGDDLVGGAKQQQVRTAYSLMGSSRSNNFNMTEPCEETKARKLRQLKDGKGTKSTMSARGGSKITDRHVNSASSNGWNNERGMESDGDDLEVSWKHNLGLNQINFDESAMPVPVCTCTGSPQPCYRWGNGGWQSACCTTTISMYPLPQMANKRYSRVGGRKMSGSAFGKLLNRLAAEGYDFSNPLDLKEHWAKHGTNRYSTLK